jgi:hypothetical protein
MSDHQELLDAIRKSLQDLRERCPSTKTLEFEDASDNFVKSRKRKETSQDHAPRHGEAEKNPSPLSGNETLNIGKRDENTEKPTGSLEQERAVAGMPQEVISNFQDQVFRLLVLQFETGSEDIGGAFGSDEDLMTDFLEALVNVPKQFPDLLGEFLNIAYIVLKSYSAKPSKRFRGLDLLCKALLEYYKFSTGTQLQIVWECISKCFDVVDWESTFILRDISFKHFLQRITFMVKFSSSSPTSPASPSQRNQHKERPRWPCPRQERGNNSHPHDVAIAAAKKILWAFTEQTEVCQASCEGNGVSRKTLMDLFEACFCCEDRQLSAEAAMLIENLQVCTDTCAAHTENLPATSRSC